MPQVGEVWTSKRDPEVTLKVTEVYVAEGEKARVYFDQQSSAGILNFTDYADTFVSEANPPEHEPETHELAIETEVAPPASKTVEELLAAQTPREIESCQSAARTCETLHEMLRLTKPSIFEAVTCVVSLVLEVADEVNLPVAELCALIQGTNDRLLQHRSEQAAEQAAERASEAS